MCAVWKYAYILHAYLHKFCDYIKLKLLNFVLEKEYALFFAQVYDKPFRMLAMIMIIQFFSFRLRLIGFFSHLDYSGNSSLLAA